MKTLRHLSRTAADMRTHSGILKTEERHIGERFRLYCQRAIAFLVLIAFFAVLAYLATFHDLSEEPWVTAARNIRIAQAYTGLTISALLVLAGLAVSFFLLRRSLKRMQKGVYVASARCLDKVSHRTRRITQTLKLQLQDGTVVLQHVNTAAFDDAREKKNILLVFLGADDGVFRIYRQDSVLAAS